MRNQLTKGYLATIVAIAFLLSPLGAAAVGVTWDYSSTVLKPLAAVLGSRTSVGTTTATTNATLTVSATSTDTTVVLSLLKSTGASIFSALANGNVGVGTTTPYGLLSIGGNVVIGASTAGGTLGDLYLPKLGTAAGTLIAVDANGMVIATSTTSGVTSVSGTYPVVSSGGATPAISLAFGTTTANLWTAALQTFGNASTSQLTVSGSTWLTGITSAIPLTDSTGLISEYAGTSCTNQFVSSLSALGAATCATVANTDLANSSLTVNGTAISLGSSGTITAASSTLLADSSTFSGSNVFSGTKNTITSASTTNLTVGTTLVVPAGASQAPTRSGDTTVDTTDNQLKIGTGSGTAVYDQRRLYSFGMVGTTTSQTITGTTTISAAPFPRTGVTVDSLYCTVAPVGATVDVLWQYGPTPTQIAYIKGASSTPGIYTFSSSNTPGANASSTVTIGTPASSPTSVGCTAESRITGT